MDTAIQAVAATGRAAKTRRSSTLARLLLLVRRNRTLGSGCATGSRSVFGSSVHSASSAAIGVAKLPGLITAVECDRLELLQAESAVTVAVRRLEVRLLPQGTRPLRRRRSSRRHRCRVAGMPPAGPADPTFRPPNPVSQSRAASRRGVSQRSGQGARAVDLAVLAVDRPAACQDKASRAARAAGGPARHRGPGSEVEPVVRCAASEADLRGACRGTACVSVEGGRPCCRRRPTSFQSVRAISRMVGPSRCSRPAHLIA